MIRTNRRCTPIALLMIGALLPWSGGRLDPPVADAARDGDLDAVRALVQEGADVNAAHADGMTPLHWAAYRGDDAMTALLLYAGANPHEVTRLGDYTPLHLAARSGNPAVVRDLLEGGADPVAMTATGVEPVHLAAGAGKTEAVVLLLEHGADIDTRDREWRQTPLMFAAAANHVSTVETLLEHGADPSLTARVIDIPEREREDRAAYQQRNDRLAALRAAAQGDAPAARGRAPAGGRTAERGGNRRPEPRPSPPTDSTEADEGRPLLRGTTEIDPLSYADLVGTYGGLTALLLAVREGHAETTFALLDGGADINGTSAGDHTSPLLMATINGHFDLARGLLARGADPNLASDAGARPLYATINMEWIPKSRHPQPTAAQQQETTYLELMEALLKAGADPNARLEKTLWYTTYNNDLLRVDRAGATAFWRAAYATDVAAMKLLVSYGADPNIPTRKMPERRRRGAGPANGDDPSGLPPVPIGGPAVYPIHAASGVGYGLGYAANSHRHVPGGWLPAVKYLVEELGTDVNVRDHEGYNAIHHAASRGDNELIEYLVEHGGDVTAVSRRGQTTVDMANGPVQRIQPFPETIALLESLGAINNHNCVSC